MGTHEQHSIHAEGEAKLRRPIGRLRDIDQPYLWVGPIESEVVSIVIDGVDINDFRCRIIYLQVVTTRQYNVTISFLFYL